MTGNSLSIKWRTTTPVVYKPSRDSLHVENLPSRNLLAQALGMPKLNFPSHLNVLSVKKT